MPSPLALVGFLLAIIVLLLPNTAATPICVGMGWTEYKNEKCYKLVDTFANWNNAKTVCALDALQGESEIPKLASIKSRLVQEFVTDFVFNRSGVTVSVWLGASRIGNPNFLWEDGKNITYTNWAEGFPSDEIGRDCVEMVSHLSRVDQDGQWKDTSCGRGNLVLCEKLQTWSWTDMQRMIIEDSHNAVPVGFVYAQLPFTSTPDEIWPTMQWADISEEYAGRFFRVVGGNAPVFGQPQADAFQGHEHTQYSPNYQPAQPGGSSTFYYSSNQSPTLNIVEKSGFGTPRYANETRPVNYSMRIWKRYA